jgi:hypothetical protein
MLMGAFGHCMHRKDAQSGEGDDAQADADALCRRRFAITRLPCLLVRGRRFRGSRSTRRACAVLRRRDCDAEGNCDQKCNKK